MKIGFYGETPVGPEEFEAMAAGAVLRLQQDLDEARMWAIKLKRIAKDIWLEQNSNADIDLIFDDDTTMPEWLHDTFPIAPLEEAKAP